MAGFLSLSLSAFGLGLLHALEPGHGKSLMVGSLVASERKWRDPIVLASSTAFGHMLGILLFTTVSFTLAHGLVPSDLKFYTELVIGIFTLGTGIWMLSGELKRVSVNHSDCSCCSNLVSLKKNKDGSRLTLIGLLVGLVPCPSAVALAASTATLGTFSEAISVAFIFGFGVAASLLLIGVMITCSSERIRRFQGMERLTRYLRLIGPIMLSALGLIILFHIGEHPHHH
jgi:nickel/cobalt exporter